MELLLDPITSFQDDEDSLTLDEDATLEELQMSLRLELSGVGVELDELEAILKELDDRATLDEELFFWELEDSVPGPECRDELLERSSIGVEDDDKSTLVEDDDVIEIVEEDDAAEIAEEDDVIEIVEEDDATEIAEEDDIVEIVEDDEELFSDNASNALVESSPQAITKMRELRGANIRFIIASLIASYNHKYTIAHPSSQYIYATKFKFFNKNQLFL